MRQLTFTLTLTVATLFLSCNRQTTDNGQTINPLIGDISFVDKFGVKPTATTDEDLRIKTHLEYVENVLRQKDVSNLIAEQIEKRNHLLDLLHDYWTTGLFPRNYDYKDERQPCFIDKDGIICAVGYLVEQTAGRHTAEQINDNHKYDKVLAMNDNSVDSWIKTSGLTKEECAMIQPAYGWQTDNSTYINTSDAIFSGGLMGLNLGFTALSFSNTAKGNTKRTIPTASLIFGLGQIGLGSYELWNYSNARDGNDYTTMRKLGITNIAIGTATALIGTYTLVTNRQKKNKTTAWNIYSFPTADRNVGLGLCWSKKL